MLNRRRAVQSAAAGLAAVAVGTTNSSLGQSASSQTWLDYAVNVEMIWGGLPFLDRLKNVAKAGFTYYEFWPWKNKDVDATLKLNNELKLQPTQFSAFWGITNPKRKDEFLEAVKGAIPVAQKLGVKKLCVVAGEESEGLSKDQQNKAVIEALKAGAELVEPAGITLILEPLNILVDHPRQLVVHSAHAAEIIKSVGSPFVKMLFDVYHQQISEGNLSGNIRKYHDVIGYFQIADHPGRHEPGTGEINYARVLKAIHDSGYKDPIGLELSPLRDPLEALQAVRKADAEAKALA